MKLAEESARGTGFGRQEISSFNMSPIEQVPDGPHSIGLPEVSGLDVSGQAVAGSSVADLDSSANADAHRLFIKLEVMIGLGQVEDRLAYITELLGQMNDREDTRTTMLRDLNNQLNTIYHEISALRTNQANLAADNHARNEMISAQLTRLSEQVEDAGQEAIRRNAEDLTRLYETIDKRQEQRSQLIMERLDALTRLVENNDHHSRLSKQALTPVKEGVGSTPNKIAESLPPSKNKTGAGTPTAKNLNRYVMHGALTPRQRK